MGDYEAPTIAGKKTTIQYLNQANSDYIYLVYTGNTRNSNKRVYIFKEYLSGAVDRVALADINGQVSRFTVVNDQIPFIVLNKMSLRDIQHILSSESYEAYRVHSGRYAEGKADDIADSGSYTKYNNDKVTKMRKDMKTQIADANMKAVKIAAQSTAGSALNKTLLSKLRPQLPMMARGYADHALAEVVVANIANFAVANFAQDNAKAVWASEAMMVAAMSQFLQSFNIEAIIDELLDGVEVPTEE